MADEDKTSPSSTTSENQTNPNHSQSNRGYWLGFRGYNKETKEYTPNRQLTKTTIERQPGKTLWDWLQLLIIPLVLAVGGLIFNAQLNQKNLAFSMEQHQHDFKLADRQHQNDLQLAGNQQREAALQNYFDKMSELLLNKNLNDPQESNAIRAIARARTLTTLRSLNIDATHPDKVRKGILLQFLYTSGLITNGKSIVNLAGADLTGADLSPLSRGGTSLSGIDLSGIDLSRANLGGANMDRVNLHGANLEDTNLFGVDLHKADLTGVNAVQVILSNTDLTQAFLGGDFTDAFFDGADLRGADLREVKIDVAILKTAKSLDGATLPAG